MLDLFHRLVKGHWPRWCATGYDFLTLHWSCLTCDETPRWYSRTLENPPPIAAPLRADRQQEPE